MEDDKVQTVQFTPALFGKITAIGVLCMAQGLPSNFTNILLPTVFREEGLPLEMFFVFTIASSPVWFKWLLAPMIDRYGIPRFGYRKTWLVPMTLLGALTYVALAFFKPTVEAVWIITGILFIKTIVMALQDVSVDGYNVENLKDGERTYGAASISVFSVVGNIISAAGLVSLYEVWGWRDTTLFAAALLVLFTAPAALRKEAEPSKEKLERLRQASDTPVFRVTLDAFKHFLGRHENRFVVLVVLAQGLSIGFFQSLAGPFLIDNGLEVTEIGIVFAISGTIGGVVGAICAALMVRMLGQRRTAFLGMLLQVPGFVVVWVWTTYADITFAGAAVVLSTVIFLTTPLGLVFDSSRMQWCSPAQSGTDYSIQSSLFVGARGLGPALAGLIAGTFGYSAYFFAAGVIAVTAGILLVISRNRIEAIMRDRDPVSVSGLSASL